jgi:hypothetical protein
MAGGDIMQGAGAGDQPVVTLSLHDLLPDANGEIVIVGADNGLQLSIVSDERVCDSGIADHHLTATGVDVAGLSYYAFEGGMKLYAPTEVAVTVASAHG